ncbi:hypothetical protein FB566_4259 [Stackebrandtia endophytica]|uniref:Uncharacterized protein n=1 Tax=Stackebrandtia endophytica TaxID=1496996 RepID=A0A543B1G0_9ACTN|nr:hypothetical protein [Stackebrandtia endophytica]TQL78668.1 hypothetical protein FB566_4259 [Stackebrandtia endophytica]
MTYPPQQPEDGWNRQQYGQYPADPGQPSDGQAYQDQQAYGQPQYDPATGQPYPQQDQGQYQADPGQYQYDQSQYAQEQYPQEQYPQAPYNHEEPPTDQTQSLGEGADRTQVIGQQPRPVDNGGQPVQEEPVSYADDEPVQPFAPAHDPANPYQHQQPYPQQPPPPEQPYQAPVSVNPASGQPYHPPVSASPASGQPYQAPVSANPASGQPFQQYQQPYPQQPPIYQPNQAPPGVPESPFAAPQGQPHLPAPISAQPSSAQPWGGGVVPQFTPKRNKGVPSWVYIVGTVVVVLALALGAVFWFGLPGGEPGTDPTPQATGDSQSPEPEIVGGGELLTDEESGLGFITLPEPWANTDEIEQDGNVPGFTSFTGQYVAPTQDNGYIGLVGVGGVDPDAVEYLGTDSLRTAAAELSAVTDAATWEAEDVKAGDAVYEYLRIDGRRAILMNYQVSFTDDSPPETGAAVFLAVVDLGDGKAAAFIAHVPDTLAETHLDMVRDTVMTMQF